MFSNFDDIFKQNEVGNSIPREIMDSLNENLPEGFEYASVDKRTCAVVSKKGGFNIKAEVDTSKLPSDFKPSTMKELLEFCYRSQQSLKIIPDKNGCITINGKSIKIDDMVKLPYEKMSEGELFIIPEKFKPPFLIEIEGEDIKKNILFERQPYEDMNKSFFKNIDNESISIQYIINEKNHSVKFNVTSNLEKTRTIIEQIECFKLLNSFLRKSLKINGVRLFKNANINLKNSRETESISKHIELLEKVYCIEKKIKCQFKPLIKITNNDLYKIETLYKSLIEKIPFKEYVKMDKIEIVCENIEKISRGMNLEITSFNKDLIEFSGEKIDLFNVIGLFGFKVCGIEIINEDENKYSLLIEPIKGKKIYQSIQYFLDEEEARNCTKNISKLKNADLISI